MFIIVTLASAFLNMLGGVFQRTVAKDVPHHHHLHYRMVGHLLRQPLWLAGIGCMVAGFILQAIALGSGPIATIQPLLTSSLIWLLLALRFHYRLPLGRREWLGGLAMVAGLSGFILIARPAGSSSQAPGWRWAVTLTVVAAIMAATLLITRHRSRKTRAAVIGVLAGFGFALTAAITKSAMEILSHQGLGVLATWQPYLLVIFGGAALFLMQNCYHAGPLSYSQPALTSVDPLASIGIGLWLFGEKIITSPLSLIGELGSLAVLIAGVVALTTSPIVLSDKRLSYLELPVPELPDD